MLTPLLIVLGVGGYWLFSDPPATPAGSGSPASPLVQPSAQALGTDPDPLRALPRSAVVLVHGPTAPVGLDQQMLFDVGTRFEIDYIALADPGRIDAHLRTLGVTHVLWPRDDGATHPMAAELVFRVFAAVLHAPAAVAAHVLAALPSTPIPPGPSTQLTLVVGCNRADFANWLTEVEAKVADASRRDCNTISIETAALVEAARNYRFVLVDGRRPNIHDTLTRSGFHFLFRRDPMLAFVNLTPNLTAETVRTLTVQ